MAKKRGGMRKGRYHCTKKVKVRVRGHFRKVCKKFAKGRK